MRRRSIAYGSVVVVCLACTDVTAPTRESTPSTSPRDVISAPDPNFPNEPPGLTLVNERAFNTKAATLTDVVGAET